MHFDLKFSFLYLSGSTSKILLFGLYEVNICLLVQIKALLAYVYEKLKLKQILQPPIIASVSFSSLKSLGVTYTLVGPLFLLSIGFELKHIYTLKILIS